MNTPEETLPPAEDWRDHPQPTSAVLPAEAWDRRSRDPLATPALRLLGRAARYLIHDQMRADRVFTPGAWDAVELLWTAMADVDDARVNRERVERLTSLWLPQQIFSRLKGSGPSN